MKLRVLCLAMFVSVGLSGVAGASQVYVVHGIPGQDLGAPAALPVDVCLAGGTLVGGLTGVEFGAIAGPLDLPAGRYDLEIRVADGRCGGALAVANSIYVGLGESATVVAHLSEQGSPALTKFINDVRSLGDNRSRLVVRHGAAVVPVNVTVRGSRGLTLVPDIANSTQSSAITLRPANYRVAVYPKGSLHPALSASAELEAGLTYFAYAVGPADNGTLALVIQVIPIP
jgi:Domain of unknown function (DUF4397)